MTCESERRKLESLRKKADIDPLELGTIIYQLDITCPNTSRGEDTYGHAPELVEGKPKDAYSSYVEQIREKALQRAKEILSDYKEE